MRLFLFAGGQALVSVWEVKAIQSTVNSESEATSLLVLPYMVLWDSPAPLISSFSRCLPSLPSLLHFFPSLHPFLPISPSAPLPLPSPPSPLPSPLSPSLSSPALSKVFSFWFVFTMIFEDLRHESTYYISDFKETQGRRGPHSTRLHH